MSAFRFSVNGYPIQFTQKEHKIMSEEGDCLDVWDVFLKKAREIYFVKSRNKPMRLNALRKNGYELFEGGVSLDLIRRLKEAIGESPKFSLIARDEGAGTKEVIAGEKAYTVKQFVLNEVVKAAIKEILLNVLDAHLTHTIEDYLKSYFKVDYISFSRTMPDADPIVSFRWHCDAGPKCQTHIMIYLDSFEETGGTIEFLDYKDSKKLRDLNYGGVMGFHDRKIDIRELLNDCKIYTPEPKIGDAMVFNATQVFHKGVHPTRKHRDVIFLILRSDLKPWQETLSDKVFDFPNGRFLYEANPFIPYIEFL